MRLATLFDSSEKGLIPRCAFGAVMVFYSCFSISISYAQFDAAATADDDAEISYWSPQRAGNSIPAAKRLLGSSKPKKNPKDPDPAYSAFLLGEYLTALEEAKKAGQKGSAEAFTLMGYIHEKGLGVARNDKLAYSYYAKAAAMGDVNAIFAQAVMLTAGRGVKKDRRTATQLFDKAARKGHAAAQYNLAMIYINGFVVKENYKEAVFWLKKSAKQRNYQAQYDLGTLYALGKGVPKDKAKSVFWISQAAKGGLINAELEYAILLFNEHRAEKRKLLTKMRELADVKALKTILNLQGAAKIKAMRDLGAIKKLPEKEKARAIRKLVPLLPSLLSSIPKPIRTLPENKRLAVIAKIKEMLAALQKKEAKNYPKAFGYFVSSAQKGNPIAQNRLARLYAYGIATQPDIISAAKWHLLARSRGVADIRLDALLRRLTSAERQKVYKQVDDWENLTILN